MISRPPTRKRSGMPDSTVRRFFGEERPTSAVGRLALARVLRDEGDRAGAEREVRAVWQSAELSAELKTTMLEAFRDELTPADHLNFFYFFFILFFYFFWGRMDRRIGAKDVQHFAGAGCSGKALRCSAFRRAGSPAKPRATPFLRLTSCSHVCVRHSA